MKEIITAGDNGTLCAPQRECSWILGGIGCEMHAAPNHMYEAATGGRILIQSSPKQDSFRVEKIYMLMYIIIKYFMCKYRLFYLCV